ncbi:MAG: DUF2839 family protein [Cyanobacteria bacterium K_Offshore_surface_m2_239]|nr:DUF2839 family protein [Cyanobacteria bacterium K_Offshore_surface_m2_239]
MGEAKRRAAQGLPPREKKPSEKKASDKKAGATLANAKGAKAKSANAKASPRLVSWLPLTREQADRFVAVSTRGAWIGIGALVFFWVTVRFLGPALGWWTLADG